MKNTQDDYRLLLTRLFNESRIDYGAHFSKLFSAFNLWYARTTMESIDTRALNSLKTRPYLWRAGFNDECLSGLLPIMRKIMILTQHRPITRSASG